MLLSTGISSQAAESRTGEPPVALESSKDLMARLVGKSFVALLGLCLVNMIALVLSSLIVQIEKLDWRILLFINPNHSVPFLDDLMILVTDFSIPVLALVILFWEGGYLISKYRKFGRIGARRFLKATGLFLFLVSCSAVSWSGYAHPYIFFALALILAFIFWALGNTMTNRNEETLRRLRLLFWVAILSALLTQVSVEIVKHIVARPRPLSGSYPALDQGLRIVKDEVVRSGYSYPSSHSAMFFALLTPLIFTLPGKGRTLLLVSWGLLLALSRVYLAAHFPFCSLAGAGLGFLVAFLVIRIFGPAPMTVG